MRCFVAIALWLTASVALASGKITFKPSVSHDGKDKSWSLGLAVFEKVLPGLFVDTWHGGGEHLDSSGTWMKSEFGLMSFVGNLGLGIGNVSLYDLEQEKWSHRVYGKVALELW